MRTASVAATCEQTSNRVEIEAFLRRDPMRHLYALGDLDGFFWPRTTWFGAWADGELKELLLVYRGNSLPTILAFSSGDDATMGALLAEYLRGHREQYYAHLSVGLLEGLSQWGLPSESHGLHVRMALGSFTPAKIELRSGEVVDRLDASDLPAIERLLATSYPGNWFDPAMLATRQYVGVRRGAELISMAGVHVFSPTLRVAAIGNVTTHVEQRGRGLAAVVCTAVCTNLRAEVDDVGLNVAADNRRAIACYERLGFEVYCQYHEVVIRADQISG